MTDIFFSYKREDLDQIKKFIKALEPLGYDIFWDQKIPVGQAWDTWIKGELDRARAVVVFWTPNSIGTDNVQHEARIAHLDGKLIQVLLTPLEIKQYPLGLDSQQAIDLVGWNGDASGPLWEKFLIAIEAKTTPGWVKDRLAALEAALKSERQNRAMSEARANSLDARMRTDAQSASDAIQDLDARTKDLTKQRLEIEKLLEMENQQSAELKEELRGTKTREEKAQRLIGSLVLERDNLKAKKSGNNWIRLIAAVTLAMVMGNALSHYAGSPLNNFKPWTAAPTHPNAMSSATEATGKAQTDNSIADLQSALTEERGRSHTLNSRVSNLTKERDTLRGKLDGVLREIADDTKKKDVKGLADQMAQDPATAAVQSCDDLAANPADPEAPKRRGASIRQLDSNYELAITGCEEATKQSPTNWRYHYQLGRALHARAESGISKAGDTKRFERAAAAFRKAANGGHAAALCNLAFYYARTDRPPIQQDHAIAFAYALRSYELGSTSCISVLGDYYRDGVSLAPNYKQALQYYEIRAERGSIDFIGRIASVYALASSMNGMELRDSGYIRRAPEGRFKFFISGLFADQGVGGFTKNPKEAARLLLASVEGSSKIKSRELSIVADFFKKSADHRLELQTRQEFQQLLYAATVTHGPIDGKLLSPIAQQAIERLALK